MVTGTPALRRANRPVQQVAVVLCMAVVSLLFEAIPALAQVSPARPDGSSSPSAEQTPAGNLADFDNLLVRFDRDALPDNERATIRKRVDEIRRALPGNDAMRAGRLAGLECWTDVPTDAKERLRRANEQLAQAANDSNRYVKAWLSYCVATTAQDAADDGSPLQLADNAVLASESVDDVLLKAQALELRASVHSWRGNHGQALLDLLAAKRLGDEGQLDSYYRQGNQSKLVTAYRRMGEFDKAEPYAKADYARARDDGDSFREIEAALALAYIYAGKRQNDLAKDYYRRAIEVSIKRKDGTNEGYANMGLANVAVDESLPKVALQHANRAQQLFRAAGVLEDAQLNHVRAKAYQQLGNTDLALKLMQSVIPTWETQKQLRFLVYGYEMRGDLYAQKGMWQQAAQDYKLLADVTQKVNKNTTDQQAFYARTELQEARHQLEVDRLEDKRRVQELRLQEVSRTRNWQRMALVAVAALALVLGLFTWSQVRKLRLARAMALIDPLTNTMNRRGIEVFAEQALSDTLKRSQSLCALVFDIDHFKQINDTYGHSVGDQVLKRVTQAASSVLRNADRVGRVGGEEFLVVLPGADLKTAEHVGERLRDAINKVQYADIDPTLQVTVSYGTTARRAGESSLSDVVKRADAALYQAKAMGRNRGVALA